VDFVKIYRAANLSEARFIEGILINNSIEVSVLGEGLSIAVGELPTDVVQVNLFVKDNDASKAKSLIDEYEKKINNKTLESWLCKDCDASNPETFEICWRCNS